MVKGKIFDMKDFAVHDGPGIRTTVFFKGCPFRCWWCHNPEGIEKKDELFFYRARCIDCGRCSEVCSKDAVSESEEGVQIDRKRCEVCGRCAEVCPSEALKITGREVSVEDIFKEIDRSTLFHDTSGGGITLSGGEPFFQYDLMEGLVERCDAEGIHVAVDTSGHVDPEKFESMIDKIDLFLYDLKFIDEELHEKYTGLTNKNVLKNLQTLLDHDNEVWIRIPLIPEITATDENIGSIIEFLSQFKGVKEIHLLPYHGVKEKYNRLGKEYKLEVKNISRQRFESVRKRFEDEGYDVKEGG